MMPYGIEARNSTKVSFSLDEENFIYFARGGYGFAQSFSESGKLCLDFPWIL